MAVVEDELPVIVVEELVRADLAEDGEGEEDERGTTIQFVTASNGRAVGGAGFSRGGDFLGRGFRPMAQRSLGYVQCFPDSQVHHVV